MTGKYKILLPLLLIFLLVGCGKTDDGLTIEGHDWTYANAIDSEGQSLDLPALTCSSQDGTLTVTDSDGSTQSGTYTLTQHDANDVLYDLTLDSETGTALVGVTEYTDAAGGKSSEYTLILSLPERTVFFRADMARGIKAARKGGVSLHRAGGRLRGIFSFLGKRISPFDPQEKGIRIASEQLEELQCLPIALPIARRSRVGLCYTTWLAPTIPLLRSRWRL